MAAIFQTTFQREFPWMKSYEFRLEFHWSLFLGGPINNIPALVQIMTWCRSGHKPLSEPMMVRLLMHICITWPQWDITWEWQADDTDQTVNSWRQPIPHLYVWAMFVFFVWVWELCNFSHLGKKIATGCHLHQDQLMTWCIEAHSVYHM